MPLGHFFLAIDVESLCDVETFKKNSSEVLDGLRKSKVSPRAEHGGRIFTAGEKEHIARVERTAAGGCPVPASLQKDMKVVRERFPELMKKYPIGSFPFE
jgi:LDH2 family malate/lactate/ureidoglycolate dehydrogenase